PAKTNKNYKMIFIGAGTEDTAVNGGRTMHDALTKAGVKHLWSEDPGYGHDYQIWRQYFYRRIPQPFRDCQRPRESSGVLRWRGCGRHEPRAPRHAARSRDWRVWRADDA